MRSACCLLCSLILLTSVGCQSVSSGTGTLLDQLNGALGSDTAAEPSAAPQSLAALLASRRQTTSQPSSSPPAAASLPGRWADNDVLQMVIETEFADATPQERQQWMQRLAGASEDEVRQLLAQRRRQLNATGLRTASLSSGASESAQQIILTNRNTTPAAQVSAAQPSTPTNQPPQPIAAPQHPLRQQPSQLAAPAPGGDHLAPPSVPTGSPAPDEPPTMVVPTIYDAFGAGGESRAARKAADGASRIGLAGRHSIDADTTEAEAIARELEANKAAQSVYWQEDLDKLITLLETQIAQQTPGDTDFSREQYVRQHVALRMLYLIASRRPDALQAIPAIATDRQEFWTRMFWALSSIFDEEALPNSTVRAAETVAQLRAAIRQIEPRASLELQGTLFCQQINGYGDFHPFDDSPFAAGQPVLIYTEVRNFQSQSTAEGDYRTVLRSTITIQRESVSGPVVFKHELPETEDRCQSRRQDYFHSYRIQLPENLKPGPHVLTLDVTDMLTGKNGSTTLNFLVR